MRWHQWARCPYARRRRTSCPSCHLNGAATSWRRTCCRSARPTPLTPHCPHVPRSATIPVLAWPLHSRRSRPFCVHRPRSSHPKSNSPRRKRRSASQPTKRWRSTLRLPSLRYLDSELTRHTPSQSCVGYGRDVWHPSTAAIERRLCCHLLACLSYSGEACHTLAAACEAMHNWSWPGRSARMDYASDASRIHQAQQAPSVYEEGMCIPCM